MIRFIEKLIKWFEEILTLQDAVAPTKGFSLSRKLQFILFRNYLIFKRHRGIFIRAIIAWLIGLFALHLDEVGSYDLRLSLRGDQNRSSDIILIDFSNNDFNYLLPQKNSLIDLTHDSLISADSQYWNLNLWRVLLEKILSAGPKVVGVSFYFDERMSHNLSAQDWELFTNKNIIWMGALSQGGTAELPPFADKAKKNYGFADFSREEDGMIRAVAPLSPGIPSFALKLAQKTNFFSQIIRSDNNKALINFRGSSHSFTHIKVHELLENKVLTQQFKNKTIIVGMNSDFQTKIATPVGVLTRSEIIAHLTDNLINDRWITRLPKMGAYVELFIIMLISVFFMTSFPQMVAFVFLTFFSLIICSFSVWFFDSFHIWTPAFSPLIQISSTWALFVGYLASRMEQKNWQLEQEKKSIAQVEQLKNNFVSLISHDLKTPIAKIQAIVERLLLTEYSTELTQDLKSLRSSSHELHRYIQSILKILRVEARDFHLNKEVTDINDLVKIVVTLIQPLAKEKQILIEDNLEPLFSIEVDSTLIQEVLSNILENAIKYTPSGGQISIKTEEIEDFVCIKISDTGEGINPAEIENVFGKFVRGKNQELKTKGSGLGLYLVKYFVELHGGRVLLSSQVGKGTTVELYLPTEPESAIATT